MAMVGASKNIEFCGVYSEDKTGETLSGVDVLVIPSLCYDSYSMILYEALACNVPVVATELGGDRKSTRLNSSHPSISYAVFCLKKKKLDEAHRPHRGQ